MFEAAGTDSINLGLGEPDFPTPDHICDAAVDSIRIGHTKYTPGAGIPELRNALSEKFLRDNNISVSPDEVIVTSGASEALHIAMQALVEPGDDVLVPDPGFVSYSALSHIAGGRVIGVPLTSLGLVLDPDVVAEYITPNTKVLIVNSPSNPCGSVQSRKEIQALSELAEDYDFTIVSDEVYEFFIYVGEHASPAEFTDNVVTVNAASKTYSMTGWRLGYLAARMEYIEQFHKVHQYVQACANSVAQAAVLAAITGSQDCVEDMRKTFKARRDLLIKGLLEMGVECPTPAGAFYAFPRVGDGDRVASELASRGVITVPGSAFGEYAREHIRISYATSESDIIRALERMRDVIL
ncbi:MAG: pyridoxal phosphate-dependent aminotransferase [Euryarchaeota archaeon]|nr:pyridoxal phosphate-dependent aminotransferase [Euryarchaeota archaeon]